MTIHKPEVVAWYTPATRGTLPVVALNDRSQRGEPLIRLSDYEALQAETTKFKVPKSIAGHKAVQECLDGYSEGFDYRYDVYLKEGYVFRRGRMAGSRHGCFNTVADFLHAEPVKTLPEAP